VERILDQLPYRCSTVKKKELPFWSYPCNLLSPGCSGPAERIPDKLPQRSYSQEEGATPLELPLQLDAPVSYPIGATPGKRLQQLAVRIPDELPHRSYSQEEGATPFWSYPCSLLENMHRGFYAVA
jgi:hypothetical protein